MRATLRAIHLVVRHPLTTMITGVVFLFAGIAEVLEASIGFVGAAALESHHAILVLGVITLFKGLGEMVEAEDVLDRGAAERVAESNAGRDGRASSPDR